MSDIEVTEAMIKAGLSAARRRHRAGMEYTVHTGNILANIYRAMEQQRRRDLEPVIPTHSELDFRGPAVL